ncbi:MAG: phosphotransferase family protein [Nocardioidaceae bacterium]
MSDLAAVRDEDAFDVAAVVGWLRAEGVEVDGVPQVQQFSGGASNLTYLLSWPDRELVLRRPPVGRKARGAHDMRREFLVQQRLRPVFPYLAEMLVCCTDPAVIGSDFYVMQRLAGTILRADAPVGLGLGLSEPQVRDLCLRTVDTLVALHQVDVSAAGLDDLGKGAGYVARQVGGWTERYRAAKTADVPDLESTMTWLAAHQPADVRICVIHNDFRFDNLVLDPSDGVPRVVGVLDWEMATLGDPLMDLGGSMAYWVQADDDETMRGLRRQPTDLPGMLTRQQVVDHYCARMGLPAGDWLFYEVFGLFRLAVIIQQIYYRYVAGQTHNPAFRDFGVAVALLDQRCRRLIGVGGR